MEKRKPEFKYKKTPIVKILIYKSILKRLVEENGVILEFIKNYNEDPNYPNRATIGYWTGVRMLMPIVETLATIEKIDTGEFLENRLGFGEFGSIVWHMFRNSLLHGDLPYTLEYNGEEVIWSIHFQNIPQFFYPGTKTHPATMSFCIMQLYNDLVNYLNSQILKNDETFVNLTTRLVYNDNARKSIKHEFEKVKEKRKYIK